MPLTSRPACASDDAAVALPAPAVAAAVRILDYLAKDTPRAGVTEIARALDINKSTCFNILLTLGHFGVVAKLPGSARYQLGPRLAELAGALRRRYGHRQLVRRQFESIVAASGATGVIGQVLGEEASYVVIDRFAPRGDRLRGPAPAVGAVFPLTAPALGCALLSGYGDEHALDLVRALEPRMKPADEARWRRQLRDIRRDGYARSLGEYEDGVNAVAAPIERSGEPYLVVGLVGDRRVLTARRIDEIGPQLAHIARALGGGLRLLEKTA